MANKGFRIGHTQFRATEPVHQFMRAIKLFGLLAGMGVASLALTRLRCGDIHQSGGPEDLSLDAGHDFGVVELKSLVLLQPGVINEERCCTMIAMGIDRPRRKDYV